MPNLTPIAAPSQPCPPLPPVIDSGIENPDTALIKKLPGRPKSGEITLTRG